MDGVQGVKVNFLTSKMNVDSTIAAEIIMRAVERAGYVASLEGVVKRKSYWQKSYKTFLTILSGITLVSGLLLTSMKIEGGLPIALFLVTMLSGGFFVAKSGFYGLKARTLDMNFLMTISAVGAAAIGQWPEAASVVFLFSLGNTMQAYAMDKTRKSIKDLMNITPKEATILRNGLAEIIEVKNIMVGDIVLVKPGERIAVDGLVVIGESTVNQAPITGESMPISKKQGDEVFAGTINHRGRLEVKATKPFSDTTIARIIHLVEEAQSEKAPSQQFVDVFARYYTPLVVLGAILITLIPPLIFNQDFLPWFKKALILLVISCPCALVISTPVAIVSAIGNAAKNGVLIKGGAHLEAIGSIKAVAFDKTGTLTAGRPVVTDIINYELDKSSLLSIAASIEGKSEHPIASAVVASAREKGLKTFDVSSFETLTGMGVRAVVAGEEYVIGSRTLIAQNKIIVSDTAEIKLAELQNEGKSVMLVAGKGRLIGILAVEDALKGNSSIAIERLKKIISGVIMLTGDNNKTAAAIAERLGIDYEADLLPQDKLQVVKKLQQRFGPVAMVGDGINDAPALAAANIGIAMGAVGTDIALETADIALMNDDLEKIPFIIKLGSKTLITIKENIIFSMVVKGAFILLTFMGLSNLWMAVFADTGAALIVILNGMRLLRVK